MTELVLFRYLHFISVFAIVGAIVAEQFLISKTMLRSEIKRISVVDGIYGLGAVTVLIAGVALWFWVGKPAAFYTKNWIFHTKLTLFILLGILSIFPTIFFMRNRKGGEPGKIIEVPLYIIVLLRLELAIIIVMPLLATLMSIGIGGF
jgi:putative membrane protein